MVIPARFAFAESTSTPIFREAFDAEIFRDSKIARKVRNLRNEEQSASDSSDWDNEGDVLGAIDDKRNEVRELLPCFEEGWTARGHQQSVLCMREIKRLEKKLSDNDSKYYDIMANY